VRGSGTNALFYKDFTPPELLYALRFTLYAFFRWCFFKQRRRDGGAFAFSINIFTPPELSRSAFHFSLFTLHSSLFILHRCSEGRVSVKMIS